MTFRRKVAALALVAALTIPAVAAAQAKKQIVIGATSSASSVFVYFVALAKAVNQHAPGLNATVVETGATVDNLRRLERGQIDVGLATPETTALRYKGDPPFKGAANPKLRTLLIFDDLPQLYLVREDSGIRSFPELAGKPFNPGINGSATELTTTMMFDILGIRIQPVKGSTSDAINAIRDRRIVGYAKAGVHDASILDLLATTRMRFLSFTPDEERRLKEKLPRGILWYDIPEGTYEGTPALRVMGLAPGVITTTALSTEDGYAILAAQDKGFDDIAAAYPNVAGKNLWAKTVEAAGTPLHAGAVKFLREKGVTIPPELLPPEAP